MTTGMLVVSPDGLHEGRSPVGWAHRARHLRTSSAGHHQALRFVLSGGTVAVVYLGLGLLLSGPLGVPIQIAIPVSYVISVLFNYSMQRWFVFAHSDAFALSRQAQFLRYVQIGAAQYALTALATAVLPDVLGLDEQVVYVATALIAAVITFIVLRLVVFHGSTGSGA
ncbi:GtrA family protein [Baekduia sp.]|jgi:putative flippase GtrA|uniref:GtrA family protein n=1 Tax=Baekduia sp. TaxID=2600305 RepID=UPI002E1643E5